MKKAVIAVLSVVVLIAWVKFQPPIAREDKALTGNFKKVKEIFTDPAVFRSALVEAIRSSETFTDDQKAHHQKMFEPGGFWANVLAERELILKEAFGDEYRKHPSFAQFEVEVLYNLGKLDAISHFDELNEFRQGNLYHQRQSR